MTTVELRVLIRSSDDREQAADNIEAEVRRALAPRFPAEDLYVDRASISKGRRR